MAKRLVRQFKTQAAPAEARGYRPQLAVQHPVDYGVPAILPPTVQRPEMVQQPPVFDLSQIPNIPMLVPPEAQLPPRAMGTPAPRHPTNTAYTPNRIWSLEQQPQVDPRLQRVTGEGDLPMFIQPTATATNLQPPMQRPAAIPPGYGQPNVGVDITPEQYTLPPQQSIVQEMPPVVDYGPITTPIAAPVQEEMGYIEPTEPYPTTGPQVTATEQAFYDPQPVESAYADPIDVPYIQPQPQPQPLDIPQDDITNLIDTIIPETLEAKTIDFPQEDPYTNQELIDQANFTQADPSIYSPETAPITVDEMTELAYVEPIAQEAAQPTYIPPPQPVQQPPITLAPEPPMPDIPAPAGGARAEDEFFLEDYHRELPHQRINIDEAIPGGSTVADPNAPIIAKILEESTPAPVSGPAVTTDVTGDVDAGEDEGGRGTMTVQEAAEAGITEQPGIPSHREPMLGAEVQPTQPTIPSGEERDIQTGAMSALPGQGQWLYTGPQGYAESRWITSGQKQGPPIISGTPEVSGPQVIRDPVTGESTIVDQPLTWWANRLGYDFNQNAPLPTGKPGMISGAGFSTGVGAPTGAQGQPDVTGVTPSAATGKGGEGRTPFQTFLESQDNAGRLIPGGLNLDAAAIKGTAAINQLRTGEGRITAGDFEGVDSFEKLGNLFETKLGLQGVGDSISTAIQELTGMEEGDLRGPGLWNTLNTPIPAFATGEFGITPLDIITVIAGGLPALGSVLMYKFMDSLMKPFTSAINKGLKGVFNTVFKRGGDIFRREHEVSQEDINAADLDVLAEELGISKPTGMIDEGTYYGADGSALATNMKSLDFGLNTVDSANSFKDVLHDIAIKADPNYTEVKYNYKTGQVDVIHADGTVTESASYVTTDSEGNMSQGTSTNKKTSKKVNWGVSVVGVESIETVAPRKDKGKGKVKGGKSIWDWIKDKIGGEDEDEEDAEKPREG
jgi:hypothetical protein